MPPGGPPPRTDQAAETVKDQREQADREMLRQDTPGVWINEDNVRGESEGGGRQHARRRSKQLAPQQVGPQRSDDEPKDKHGLDPAYDVHAWQQVEQVRQVVGQRGVVVKDRVSVTEIEIRCPAWIEGTGTERVAQLGSTVDVKFSVRLAWEPGPGEEGGSRDEGQCQSQNDQ